ncbi:hypothetical protein D3C75_1089800 [compost metagenome]
MAVSSIGCRCYALQIIQTIVKFMIAKRCRIIAHNIHRRNHRMNLVQLAVRICLLRHVCAKRCALNQIAVIEQKIVCSFRLCLGLFHQSRRPVQPHC